MSAAALATEVLSDAALLQYPEFLKHERRGPDHNDPERRGSETVSEIYTHTALQL